MPIEPSQFQIMRESFAAQFKVDELTIIYRKNGTGECVTVSSSEHDQFIKDFDRHLAKMNWHLWGWISVIIIVATALAIRFGIVDNGLYFLLGIPLTVFLRGWCAQITALWSRLRCNLQIDFLQLPLSHHWKRADGG